MSAHGIGAWRTECDQCDGSCNVNQGRGECPKREPMFDADPMASAFIAVALSAAAIALGCIFAGVLQ